MEEAEEAGVHLLRVGAVRGKLATNVGVNGTIVCDVFDLALSDSGKCLRANLQLRADFGISAVRERSVVTD